jgi:hypothetical protein
MPFETKLSRKIAMKYPRLTFGLIELIFVFSCFADEAKNTDLNSNWVSDKYSVLMIKYITGNEFEKIIEGLHIEEGLTDHEIKFYVAGYIRAWVEYGDWQALQEGRGMGLIQNLMPGVLRFEMDGWLQGCQDAAAKGKEFEMQVLDEIHHILKESPHAPVDSPSSER